MKNPLLLLFVLIFSSCEEKFSNKKYDVQFNIENSLNEAIRVEIVEINESKIWFNDALKPDDNFEVNFNIKKDIGLSEGGFIIRAIKRNSDSLILNTGYFTNYQIKGNSTKYFVIKEGKIDIKN
jgi:hypothetical protein